MRLISHITSNSNEKDTKKILKQLVTYVAAEFMA